MVKVTNSKYADADADADVTPVGAVSNTITSSGSTCPERCNNFKVSVYKGDDVTFLLHQDR